MYHFTFLHYSKDRIADSHFHDGYELFLPVNDGGHLFINDTRYNLHKGALYCIKPFELHCCFCRDEDQIERYVLRMSIDTLECMSTSATDFISVFQDAPRSFILNEDAVRHFNRAAREMESINSKEFGDDVKLQICFQSMVLMVAKWLRNREYDEIAARPEDSQRVIPILRYIHKHIAENLSLQTIAGAFYLSKSRLNQIFKSSTGFSVGEYIIACRIKKACQLLQTNMPIQEISSAAGFRDPTHFNRTFKKRMGMTPGAYQKKNAGRHAEKPEP